MIFSSWAVRCGALLVFALSLVACAEVEYASHWVKTWDDDQPTKRIDVISGDPVGNPQPLVDSSGSYYKIGKPYNISGIWYRPEESFTYDQTGIASWYGPNFHGKKTANGEIYDKYALTAAHPTLQVPSLVRVTNLQNGRSVVVRINDRGPFARGRVIDLSKRAAELLGMIQQGTARVRVQVLPEESRKLASAAKRGIPVRDAMLSLQKQQPIQTASNEPQTPGYYLADDQRAQPVVSDRVPPKIYDTPTQDLYTVQTVDTAPTEIYVQLGAFSQRANADNLRGKVTHLRSPVSVHETVIDGRLFYRVRLGPAASVESADRLLDDAMNAGYRDAKIVVE